MKMTPPLKWPPQGRGPLLGRSGQGAGVGVGILRGYHNGSRSQRFKKLIVPKYRDSTIHHQSFKKYRGLSKIILDLIGFTYVLTISGFQKFVKTPPSYFPFLFKTIVNTHCFGPPEIIVNFGVPWASIFSNIDRQDFFIDPKFSKFNFMLSSRYWSHISKIPFMFSGRYWSQIQDVQDLCIHPFFGDCNFPKCSTFWKSIILIYIKIILQKRFRIFLSLKVFQ